MMPITYFCKNIAASHYSLCLNIANKCAGSVIYSHRWGTYAMSTSKYLLNLHTTLKDGTLVAGIKKELIKT